ncbi:MAG: hypothetical protein ACOC33_00190 [bacterium]
MDNIILKLNNKFNNIKFYDEGHLYIKDDTREKYVSVTTLIHKYVKPFDKKYWLPIKAMEYGMTEGEVEEDWIKINKISTVKGSVVHNYIENYLANKIFKYPLQEILNEFNYDPIEKSFKISITQFMDFYNTSKNKLIPVKSELIVYDDDYKVAGMVDQLYYNVKYKSLQLYDWKTNKDFNYYSKYKEKMLEPLTHLDNCHYHIYSLQLSIYKHILEKNIEGLKLSDSYIVWFNGNENEKFKIIKCLDLSKEVKEILQ